MKLTKEEFTELELNRPHFAERFDTERKLKNAIDRDYNEYCELYKKPLVKKITVDVEYSKNWNVTSRAVIEYINGKHDFTTKFKASGYGYDKACAVLVALMNAYARQNALDYINDEIYVGDFEGRGFDSQKHAGVFLEEFGLIPFYDFGGDTGKYFNFKIDKIADGKTYSKYVITFFNAANGRLYARKTAVRKTTRKTVRKPAQTHRGLRTALVGHETCRSMKRKVGKANKTVNRMFRNMVR